MSNSHNSSASVVDVTVCPLQGRRKANDTPEKCGACVNPKENHKGYTVERERKKKRMVIVPLIIMLSLPMWAFYGSSHL